MRTDGTDVTQLQGQIGPLVEEAQNHLDAVFHFLMPSEEPRTDFTDMRLLSESASHVGRLLGILVEAGKWSLWAQATQQAITEHGEQATIEHVRDAIGPTLARRTSRLTTAGQSYGPVAQAFWAMECEALGQIVTTCNRLIAADASITTLIAKVAPTLGLTEDGCRAELKAGNRDVARALAEQSLQDIEADYTAKGKPVPAGLREMAMEAAGFANPNQSSGEILDPETVSLFQRMGIDPTQVQNLGGGDFAIELPGLMARRGNGLDDAARIKVG